MRRNAADEGVERVEGIGEEGREGGFGDRRREERGGEGRRILHEGIDRTEA